jgi:hypothetical protein
MRGRCWRQDSRVKIQDSGDKIYDLRFGDKAKRQREFGLWLVSVLVDSIVSPVLDFRL